jgi:signal transduction histidine kinase
MRGVQSSGSATRRVRALSTSARELRFHNRSSLWARRRLDLELEAQSLQVLGNANLLGRALDNLIENAIKYSPDHSTVEILLRQDGNHVLLSVQDHGIGIPEEHLPRISERFYRVDTARSREMGGTGLGLAIVKHVALVHGGVLDVRSTVGKGSCFTIRLPLHTRVSVPEAPDSPAS